MALCVLVFLGLRVRCCVASQGISSVGRSFGGSPDPRLAGWRHRVLSVWLGQSVSPVDRGVACSQERDGGHDDVPVQKLCRGKSNSPFLRPMIS